MRWTPAVEGATKRNSREAKTPRYSLADTAHLPATPIFRIAHVGQDFLDFFKGSILGVQLGQYLAFNVHSPVDALHICQTLAIAYSAPL